MFARPGPALPERARRLASAAMRSRKTRRASACKEFTPLLAGGDPSQAALLELPLLKACRHPHVAPVRALLARGPAWYLVTDLAPLGSWDARLKQQPQEPGQRHDMLLRFALQTASGMAYLHSRRVAHCNLKPQNLLVAPGEGVLLTDYGLSHLLPPQAQAARAAHWSCAYMAPEARQVLAGAGGGELTPAADVWSFGVCIGQALMRGEYPAPPGSLAPGSLQVQPFSPQEIGASDGPRALQAVYRACLVTLPTQRPRFDLLVEELQRAAKELCAGVLG